MKYLLIGLITAYQKTLSPDHSWLKHRFPHGVCRFRPTCSEYGKDAIRRYGSVKGSWLAVKRIGRCHPANTGGYDPVR